ncbi:transglutaminase domain-containing protein [Anoxybacterium hadale]|uniref:Transglutaminase domain-containing protein n=1 Tax=Anoxybacterium hadale TaxID=3408580 RepID=A0ACD1A9C2_9FIRM|nr:transglutaminase domain-containing protein [Clostridiales bacterium]
MKFNTDYYDTDFEISYQGSRILIKNDGPEGERLFINDQMQDQNFEPYDGYLKGTLVNEAGIEETIEVYLGGPQTSNCIIEANGEAIYSSFEPVRQRYVKEEKKETRRKRPSLMLPFIIILLAAVFMAVAIPMMQGRSSFDGNAEEPAGEILKAEAPIEEDRSDEAIWESGLTGSSSSADFIEREYSWLYGKNVWSYEMKIPRASYEYYKTVDRQKITSYSYYVTDNSDDEYLAALGQKFKEAAEQEHHSDFDMVKNIVLFVQNLNYVDDKVGTGYDEYPKFPLETLADEGGDCEDSAILLASLLRELGFGTVLIQFPDHMGVGVRGEESIQGNYFETDGIRYYYIETTSPGWEIGEIPEELKTKPARILSLVR